MMREYRNFQEIERDLKLLELQKEIDKERIILSYHQTKESLSPKRLLKSAAGSIFKNAMILEGTSKFLGFIGNKFR